MSNLTRAMMMGAAGAASGATYVDDVFSTYLYDGTGGSAQTITNGIDLSGEGGLVWIKRRDAADHALFDTVRGVDKVLFSNSALGSSDFGSSLTAFSSSGFSLGSNSTVNYGNLVSWSFRKAPGFFDVVSWTGNGTAGKTVAHSLGSVPGMIMVKCTSTGSTTWRVYHRSLGPTKAVFLDLTNAENTSIGHWNNTAPTSTQFTLGVSNDVNQNGDTYVAYVFAHDDQSFGTGGNESIIKCGTFTVPGTGLFDINLGFEPQFILYKQTSGGMGTPNWYIHDTMRGLAQTAFKPLFANLNNSESLSTTEGLLTVNPLGFKSTSSATNAGDYIYIAIRRPNKPPEAATEVFDDVIYNGTAGVQNIVNSMLYTDLTWIKRRTSTDPPVITDRLRGGNKYLRTDNAGNEATWESGDIIKLDKMYSFGLSGSSNGYVNSGSQPYISWNFKRAPGFFDIVTYTGTGSNKTENHNLASTPEFIIVRRRSSTEDWTCYHSSLGNTKYITLNGASAAGTLSNGWNNTDPTSTNFTVGTHPRVNTSGQTYLAYLFATLPGISKVGGYSGSNSAQNIDCGFTNGARFVLIKRTDGTADWFVWDTARGISSGNDPYLKINQPEVEVTNTNYINPLNAGFIVNGNIGDINTSGGSYIFLAIA